MTAPPHIRPADASAPRPGEESQFADAARASDALHARVRAFAHRALAGGFESDPAAFPGGASSDDFETLACAIARFQAEFSPGYRRLVERRGSLLDSLENIAAVPVESFRLTRVAVQQPSEDVARFVTSGTTGSAPGVHVLRTLETYRELATMWGERALFSAWPGPKTVVALAPPPTSPPTSSLGYMMRLFMEAFDGRALVRDAQGVPFDATSGARWLVGLSGLDVDGLRRAASVARARNEPLFVLATAFALVALLDALEGDRLLTPSRTVVMQTGGFKGRSREVAPDKLRRQVARTFHIGEDAVVGEYGMTELTSQLYEGTLPGAAISGPPGVFIEPPWLRVDAVAPATLRPVKPGEIGMARIIDLANVDSAVCVVTQDLVRRHGSGIELLGRRPGAPPRGCSLAFEGLIRTAP